MHGVCKYGSAVLPMWANIHPVKQSMDLVRIVFFTSTPYQNVLYVYSFLNVTDPKRGQYKDTGVFHSLDMWHGSKNLGKKIHAVSVL